MKKNILLTLGLLAVTLTGCGKAADISELTIMSPVGAPALGLYGFASSSKFETNNVPKNVKDKMTAGQKDVVVLPTNTGIQSIVDDHAPYKIAATITFGNFYIGSLGNDANGVMEATDTILLFQQNSVPDKLFHYVYGNDLNDGIHYVGSNEDVKAAVTNGFFVDTSGSQMVPNYVLIAEPALSALVSQNKLTKYADIQELYRAKSDNMDLFQASVFIKNDVEKDKADTFLNKLKKDINAAIKDSNVLLEAMNKVESANTFFGIQPQAAANALANNNSIGLGFKKAKENKAAIDKFLSLFNIAETNEEIYY